MRNLRLLACTSFVFSLLPSLGTRAGGTGGAGGGGLYLKAPCVVIGSAATVDADGTAGSAGATGGTASGGGGGGGGVIVLDTWFEESAITITAASGAAGGAGTGHAGGAGGTGIVQVIQRQ
jgi:hypothetical protein